MVGTRILRLALIAALAGCLAGCVVPVFDLESSLAYRTAGRMTKVATVGPIDFHDDQVTAGTEFSFVPSIREYPDHGALVVANELSAQVLYFAPDPVNGGIREVGHDGFERDGLRPSAVDVYVSPLRNTASDDAFFVAFRLATDIDLRIYRVDLTNRRITYPDPGDQTRIAVTAASAQDTPIAAALDVSETSSADDTLSVFTGDTGSPGTLFLEQALITDTFPAPPFTPAGSVAVPGGNVPVAAYADFDTDLDTYVVSGWSSGENYDPFVRDSGGSVSDLSSGERIDAILSDGRLYHRGDVHDRVYLPSGELELTIPSGRLRFAYETFSTPRTMIYTIAYFDTVGNYEYGNLYVDVYSIETSALSTLE